MIFLTCDKLRNNKTHITLKLKQQEWTLVYSSTIEYTVHIIKIILEDHDIESVILNKKDSSYQFGSIELYVKRDAIIKTKYLIKQAGF